MKRRQRKNFLRNLTSTLRMDATKKVLDDLFYKIDEAKLNDEKEFLKKLPITMRTELSFYLHTEWVQSVPYLRKLAQSDSSEDRSFVGELCLYLKLEVVEEGEYLFGRQEKPELLYFYKEGDVQLVFDDDACTDKLEWDVYGEIDVILFDKRYYQFRAMTSVELLKLGKADYDRIFSYLFPKKGEELTKQAIRKNQLICSKKQRGGDLAQELAQDKKTPHLRLIQISKDLQKVEHNFNALIDSIKLSS